MTSYRKVQPKQLGAVVDCGKFRDLEIANVPTVQLSENVTFPTEGTQYHRHIQSPLNMTVGEQENYTLEDYREWKKDAERTAKARGISISQL
jgi:hypothetical protein